MKILTFDIEDWFHILDHPELSSPSSWDHLPSRVESGVDTLLQLLDDTNQPASFFCLGWIAEKYPKMIRKISDAGHHIGTHSYMHTLAYTQTKKEFEDDLVRSVDVLEQLIGVKIDAYRAPGFSVTRQNLWVFEILSKLEFKVDCSVFPANRAHGGLPQYSAAAPSIIDGSTFELKSLPINTSKLFGLDLIYSGGGYFRLLPLWYLKRQFSRDPYVMTYFHPRDFDVGQPLIPGLGLARRFKSYVGIKGAFGKLTFLLNNHKFMNVAMAVENIDWSVTDRVRIS